MADILRYVGKARASRNANFGVPIITSPDEARRLAAEIGEALARMSPSERLSLFSDLQVLSDALDGRVRRLSADLAENRLKLEHLRRGRRACLSYAQSAASVVQLRRGR